MKHKGLYCILCFVLFSCHSIETESSFYYWRTNFTLAPPEQKILNDLEVRNLYVRFFDVDLSKATGRPEPLGAIEGLHSLPANLRVIPVVYITNRTFLKLSEADIPLFAGNVVSKINSISKDFSELQFDCDWSFQTRQKYFLFLEEMRKHIPRSVQLTCTIRLHQVKYSERTGIPPVNRGMLMFYNMGDLSDPTEPNSIYNKRNAEKYIQAVGGYALPLDIALPVFRWYIHTRNGKVINLVTKHQVPDIENAVNFVSQEKNTTFISRTSFFENGIYYKEGDVLKPEALSPGELISASEMLSEHLKEGKRRIVFYDLDALNLKYYDKDVFTKVLDCFN